MARQWRIEYAGGGVRLCALESGAGRGWLRGGGLADYACSGYPQYLKPVGRRPEWLRVDRLRGELGILRDNGSGRWEFREHMEERRRAEGHADKELWSGIRRGWRFGAEDFLERLMEREAGEIAKRGIHEGEVVAEEMEEKARRVIVEFWGKGESGLRSCAVEGRGIR